jgi:hypothetical protein
MYSALVGLSACVLVPPSDPVGADESSESSPPQAANASAPTRRAAVMLGVRFIVPLRYLSAERYSEMAATR